MRIISKYKDYYDWVVFETDNRKVYNRTESEVEVKGKYISSWDKTSKYFGHLYFCNKQYRFLKFDGKYYWNEEDVPNEIVRLINKEANIHYKKDIKWMKIGLLTDDKTKEPILFEENIKLGSPVIISYDDSRIHSLNPKLVDISFNRIVSPTEAYQEIYNWIPYIEPELPGPPEDISRYEAKGFDKKTSFRPKMKEK